MIGKRKVGKLQVCELLLKLHEAYLFIASVYSFAKTGGNPLSELPL